jgi:competence protein ComFC
MLSSLLDLLYPRKCAMCGSFSEEPVCGTCFSHFQAQEPNKYRTTDPLDFGSALFDYTGIGARCVQRLKYERVTSLASWMAHLMREGAEERGLLEADAIVPVPIHWSRECMRGFNQAHLLCESMPLERVRKDLLRRSKATRPQVGLTHEERLNNLDGAFSAKDCSGLASVLLIDDVLTSSGTGRECAAVLKKAGVKEVGLFCFAAERRWRG